LSLVSIGPSDQLGHSSPPHAANRLAAVHSQMVFTAVEASGVTAVIVFTEAGTTVGVATGHIELAAIHAVVKAFLTAFLVFSTKI
jgi:hypothetical protein